MSWALLWPVAPAGVRLWAILRMQASWRALLGPLWETIAAALALVVALAALLGGRLDASLPTSWFTALELLALEFLLGSVIGAIASLPGWALLGAAETSEQALGHVGEAERPGSLRALIVTFALACGLSLGLHRPLLASLAATTRELPLAEPLAWSAALARLVTELPTLLVEVTTLALALATPVLLVQAVVAVAIALLGRGPEPAAATVAPLVPALRFVAAWLALAAAWTAYPHAWARALG